MNKDENDRLRAVEEFIAEVRGGKKIVLWLFATIGALGGGAGLLALFDR